MRIILFMKSKSIKLAKIANLFDLWTMNLVFQFNVAIKRNLISEQGIRTVFF